MRALWLKAQGHSYNEICALTGWSYTKVNRCLTEGRRSFLSRYATIESGAECERWLPVLSALVDGEASREQVMALRPHLRNCPGCRTTLQTLQGGSEPLAALLPIPLAVVAGGGGDQLTHLLTRAYETIVGGFHERAIHSFTKAQTAVEAASAGKLAAVAASAAAVAGGGYATVERKAPNRARACQADEGRPQQPRPRGTPPAPPDARRRRRPFAGPPAKKAKPARRQGVRRVRRARRRPPRRSSRRPSSADAVRPRRGRPARARAATPRRSPPASSAAPSSAARPPRSSEVDVVDRPPRGAPGSRRLTACPALPSIP